MKSILMVLLVGCGGLEKPNPWDGTWNISGNQVVFYQDGSNTSLNFNGTITLSEIDHTLTMDMSGCSLVFYADGLNASLENIDQKCDYQSVMYGFNSYILEIDDSGVMWLKASAVASFGLGQTESCNISMTATGTT